MMQRAFQWTLMHPATTRIRDRAVFRSGKNYTQSWLWFYETCERD